MAEKDERKEKFKEAYQLAGKINEKMAFAPVAPSKAEEPWKAAMVLDSRTLLISNATMDVISLSFTKGYTDLNLLCIGPNLMIKRRFDTNPEKLASRQDRESGNGGLFGPGWVMDYETYCHYDCKEQRLKVTWTDNTNDYFEKRDYDWINIDTHSFTQIVQENFLKTEVTVKKGTLFYTYLFDGRLKYIRNANGMGNEIYYIGDTSLIDKIVSHCGKSFHFCYIDNKIQEISDHTGRVVTYSYEKGRLSTVKSVNGGLWRIAYDNDFRNGIGRLNKITDPNGNLDFAVHYDRKERPDLLYMQQNFSWHLGYDIRTRTISFFFIRQSFEVASYEAIGNQAKNLWQFSLSYARTNQIQSMDWSDGEAFSFYYDERGNMVCRESSKAEITEMTWDQYNRLVRETYPDGSWKQWDRNATGDLAKLLCANGYEEIYEYDGNGNLVEIRVKLDRGITAVTLYEYDAKGRIVKKIDPKKNTTVYRYKAEASVFPEITVFPNGFELEREYDALARLVNENNNGMKTQWVYNYIDLPVQIARGSQMEFRRYDYLGHLVEITLAGQKNRKYRYEYNEIYELTYIVYPSGERKWLIENGALKMAEEEVAYTYNFAGKVVSAKVKSPKADNLFCICLYVYDKNQNLIQEKISAEAKDFDEMPALVVIDYEYDDRNNVSCIHINSGEEYRFYYKGVNQLVQQVKKINASTTHKTIYEYNENGLLSCKTDLLDILDGDVSGMEVQSSRFVPLKTDFLYNDLGELANIVFPDGDTFKIVYSSDGKLLDGDYLNDIKAEPSYFKRLREMKPEEGILRDKFGRIIRKTLPSGQWETYEYDLAGNISAVTNQEGQVTLYQYNSINRLRQRTDPDGTVTAYLYSINGAAIKGQQIKIEEQVG